MTASKLLKSARLCNKNLSCDCDNVIIETRTDSVTEENAKRTVFVCIKGAKYNSHKDIPHLLSLGTAVIICEDVPRKYKSDNRIITVKNSRMTLATLWRIYYGYPDKSLVTVAVTGTKGKTTVCGMLESIARAGGEKCGVIGTNGIRYLDKVMETENSTPDSKVFYGALSQMVKDGVKYLFCEVTSQGLKQDRVYGTIFDLAIFTNLFRDHIGKNEHASFSEYRRCKGKLFTSCERAIVNAEDKSCRYFKKICKQRGVPITELSPSTADGDIKKAVRLPGSFNTANAVCAVTAAELLGFERDVILKGIENTSVCGRCERVDSVDGVKIIIDYAHNGKSLESILKALRGECEGKLICVFGAGGDRASLRRKEMGRAASRFSDIAIVTSDNPRTESPEKIIRDILRGMKKGKSRRVAIKSRREAIFYALDTARNGDTVLLAGKGAQKYEEIMGVKHPFDERSVVREYYEAKYHSTVNTPK